MDYEYDENLKCIGCGSHKLDTVNSHNGIVQCSCRQCGRKFILQSDGDDVVDRYLQERGKVFSEFERMGKDDASNFDKAEKSLNKLVESFPDIAETDIIYYWYKINIITKNFTDYGKCEEAKKEYVGIPESSCVLVSRSDIKIKNKFEEKYEEYIGEYEKKEAAKKQKSARLKNGLVALISSVAAAAIIAVFTVYAMYKPTVAVDSVNAQIQIRNSSFGFFNKFGVEASIEEISEGSDYDSADKSVRKYTDKFTLYDIRFMKKGGVVQPKGAVGVTMPLPDGIRKENACVYLLDEKEGAKETESTVSLSADTITFEATECGIYAIAERPYVIKFENTGNTSYDEQYVLWGGKIQRPSVDPTKKGYDFGGWYDGDKEFDFTSIVKQNKTLSPKWIGHKYVASLNLNGGYLSEGNTTIDVTYGSKFNLGVPSKRNRAFLGWQDPKTGALVTDAQGKSLSEWSVEGNASFTAYWGKTESVGAVYVDSEARRIRTAKFSANYSDSIYLPGLLGDNIETLRELGYTKLELKIEIDIREVDDGYQEFFITKHPTTTENGNCLYYQKNIEHGPGRKLTTVGTYTYTATIDLSLVADNMYVLYSAHGSGSNDWYRERIKLNFTVK